MDNQSNEVDSQKIAKEAVIKELTLDHRLNRYGQVFSTKLDYRWSLL